MKCRNCGNENFFLMSDLHASPPSNSYLTQEDLQNPEPFYPLRVLICDSCFLAQTEDFTAAESMFNSEYAYFSSFSSSWLSHAERYTEKMIKKLELNHKSFVVEVASNDGYLLQFFKRKGIPLLGVEPTESTAKVSIEKGINTLVKFFSPEVAEEIVSKYGPANLTVANNVLAHVPDLNGFVKSFSILLEKDGVATFEFPHLLNLIHETQFDTIYHEHFSYFSIGTLEKLFKRHGLVIFDIEELPTHGGSLRVFVKKADSQKHLISDSVEMIVQKEMDAMLFHQKTYKDFQSRILKIKYEFLEFLLEAKRNNKIVAGYGAAAKGNTLLNFSGVHKDLVSYVVDKNPAKQGKFLPGSRIPILDLKELESNPPHYLIVFPWNLLEEIRKQLELELEKKKFSLVTLIPSLRIHN